MSRPDHLSTLGDTPGIFQGYWESEQEVPCFKNGSQMLREQLKREDGVLTNELIVSISQFINALQCSNNFKGSVYLKYKPQIDFHISFGGSFLKANHISRTS